MNRLAAPAILPLFLSMAVLVGCGGGSGGGGALPLGSRFGVHVVTSANLTAPDSSAFDHPLLNGNPNALLLVTQNWNPGGVVAAYNDHPIGVWYDIPSGRWHVINRDRAALPLGAAFNYRITTGDADSYLWIATAANITDSWTTVSHPVSNGDASLALFATHIWNPAGGPGVFNTSITAITNAGANWRILNLDLSAFPASTAYSMTARSQGPRDFYHITTVGNTATNTTVLSNPLLDGNPDAVFQITNYWGGNSHEHNLGVYYDGGNWRIFNQDLGAMPAARSFTVSVD